MLFSFYQGFVLYMSIKLDIMRIQQGIKGCACFFWFLKALTSVLWTQKLQRSIYFSVMSYYAHHFQLISFFSKCSLLYKSTVRLLSQSSLSYLIIKTWKKSKRQARVAFWLGLVLFISKRSKIKLHQRTRILADVVSRKRKRLLLRVNSKKPHSRSSTE